MPVSDNIDEEQVAAFWNRVREAADDDEQTGYLTDEWPPALGANRFRGEFRTVSRWLAQDLHHRGACLDIGCGTGIWLEHLAPTFERAEGFDLSQAMVDSARRRMAAAGLAHVSIELGSLAELDREDAYDLIFVGGVLMYLRDDVAEQAVKRIHQALRKGGVLIARETANRTGTRYRDAPLSPGLFADPDAERPPYYAVYRHPRAISDMLAAGGLRVERTRYNRYYKLSDMTETWLRFVNRLRGGRLHTDRDAAERWARRVHAWRALTLLPYFYTCRFLRLPVWNLENYFFVCRRP